MKSKLENKGISFLQENEDFNQAYWHEKLGFCFVLFSFVTWRAK